jgi:hypothetical protein
LTQKERSEQFCKSVRTGSHGDKRRQETDKSKIEMMCKMFKTAVKKGICPDYVLTDKWFFGEKILSMLQSVKEKIHLVSAVKIANQVFEIKESKDKTSAISLADLLKKERGNTSRCRSRNAYYIEKKACYKGHTVKLFFISIGKAKKFHLLLTTNMNLNCQKILETYQIRWSIAVFFKECKQYLHLSSCSSNTFDAQIAHVSLVPDIPLNQIKFCLFLLASVKRLLK